ncbi:MAG: GNAT family N-acetyltransferase [Hyphomicrobiales bacterium]|nr:GNAT family N-acetyltransferase [Hyphomicrobiales bacterium]
MTVRFWDMAAMAQAIFASAPLALPAAPRRDRDGLTETAAPEISVERASFEEMARHRAAWSDLVLRAIEPNAFLEPDFALSAALHMPASQRPEFLLVWQGAGVEPRARLIGLLPLRRARPRFSGGLAHPWSSVYTPLGGPAIDRLDGARAVDALFDFIERHYPQSAGFALPALTREGPLFALLIARALVRGARFAVMGEHERAALRGGQSAEQALERAMSRKHRRELDRRKRRLAENANLTIRSAREGEALREAVEWFLALEARGWKGQRGTALLSKTSDATFVRSALRLLAAQGKCRIDCVEIDGAPVACGVLLTSGARSFYWKTAYDESLAHYSPGVLLTQAITEMQLADPAIAITDSCAIANHSMIDRLWPDRIAIADFVVALHDGAGFDRALRRARLKETLIVKAKAAVALARKKFG